MQTSMPPIPPRPPHHRCNHPDLHTKDFKWIVTFSSFRLLNTVCILLRVCLAKRAYAGMQGMRVPSRTPQCVFFAWAQSRQRPTCARLRSPLAAFCFRLGISRHRLKSSHRQATWAISIMWSGSEEARSGHRCSSLNTCWHPPKWPSHSTKPGQNDDMGKA